MKEKEIELFMKNMIDTNKITFILIGVLGLLQSVFVFSNIELLKLFINEGILSEDKEKIYMFFFLNFIVLIILGIINYLKNIISLKNNLYLLYKTRIFFLKKFSRLKYEDIPNQDTSILIRRVDTDSRFIFGVYVSALDTAISILYFIVGFTLLLKIDLKMSLIVTLLVLIYCLMIKNFNNKYKRMLNEYMLSQDKTFKRLIEALENIELLKYFKRVSFFSMRYSKDYRDFKNANEKRLSYNYIYNELFNYIKKGIPLIIYFIGGLLVIKKELSFGTIIAVIMYINLILASTDKVIEFNSHYQQYRTSKKRLSEILNINIEKPEKKFINIGSIKSIEFKNVSYKEILKDINFKVNVGEVLVISGMNGSGKSLILKIISGLLVADKGEIIVNNKILTPKEYKSLKDQITYIDSKSKFFNGNLKDNFSIIKGNQKINLINMFFEIFNLKKEIIDYKNILDENFSLGQLQKLRIIRGFICESSIYCCDEIFSNLDRNSKIRLTSYLVKQKNKILFLVTHDKDIEQKVFTTFLKKVDL